MGSHVFEGPAVVRVPVEISTDRRSRKRLEVEEDQESGAQAGGGMQAYVRTVRAKGWWVATRDERAEGCKAVEGPLDQILDENGCGEVMVAVDPGCRVVITSTDFPWKLVKPTVDCEELLAEGRRAGLKAARTNARLADEEIGWISGAGEEKILSVRLHTKCGHDAEWHTPKACGHVHCKMCNGFVDPLTRVALTGKGPIIECNRKPKGFEEYELYLAEFVPGKELLGAPPVGLRALLCV